MCNGQTRVPHRSPIFRAAPEQQPAEIKQHLRQTPKSAGAAIHRVLLRYRGISCGVERIHCRYLVRGPPLHTEWRKIAAMYVLAIVKSRQSTFPNCGQINHHSPVLSCIEGCFFDSGAFQQNWMEAVKRSCCLVPLYRRFPLFEEHRYIRVPIVQNPLLSSGPISASTDITVKSRRRAHPKYFSCLSH